MIQPSNTPAMRELFTALTHAESLPAQDRAAYASSFNFNQLVNKARLTTSPGSALYQAGGDLDNMWVACAKSLGLNVEALKLQRFHARQAATRKASGVAERKHKSASGAANTFLFCPNAITAAFAPNKYLPAVRAEFWLQKHIRQECWEAAKSLVIEYCGENRHYLLQALARANSALTMAALTTAETTLYGETLTNGGFGVRKQFWKFVGYHIDSILPKDLANIIDITVAIERETHNTDRLVA